MFSRCIAHKFIVGLLLLSVCAIAQGSPAHALATTESCFSFDQATGTILDYYENEADDPANALCPKNVEIPRTINGTTVTVVGSGAFFEKSLTSVLIPSSITEIKDSAFSYNSLTSLVIPGTVTTILAGAFSYNSISSLTLEEGIVSIGESTFSFNQLHSVTVPDSLTSIMNPDLYLGGDTAPVTRSIFGIQGQAAAALIDNIPKHGFLGFSLACLDDPLCNSYLQAAIEQSWLVAVYTASPSNPRHFTDYLDIASLKDFFNPTTSGQHFVLGGYLINPASVSLNYTDTSNQQLLQSVTLTGSTPDNQPIKDHVIGTSGINVPYPANPASPTPEELAAITTALSAYYRLGQSFTLAPPVIKGYVAPPTQSVLLSAASTVHPVVYTPVMLSGTPLASTGMAVWMVVAAGLGSLLVSAGLVWVAARKRK